MIGQKFDKMIRAGLGASIVLGGMYYIANKINRGHESDGIDALRDINPFKK